GAVVASKKTIERRHPPDRILLAQAEDDATSAAATIAAEVAAERCGAVEVAGLIHGQAGHGSGSLSATKVVKDAVGLGLRSRAAGRQSKHRSQRKANGCPAPQIGAGNPDSILPSIRHDNSPSRPKCFVQTEAAHCDGNLATTIQRDSLPNISAHRTPFLWSIDRPERVREFYPHSPAEVLSCNRPLATVLRRDLPNYAPPIYPAISCRAEKIAVGVKRHPSLRKPGGVEGKVVEIGERPRPVGLAQFENHAGAVVATLHGRAVQITGRIHGKAVEGAATGQVVEDLVSPRAVGGCQFINHSAVVRASDGRRAIKTTLRTKNQPPISQSSVILS